MVPREALLEGLGRHLPERSRGQPRRAAGRPSRATPAARGARRDLPDDGRHDHRDHLAGVLGLAVVRGHALVELVIDAVRRDDVDVALAVVVAVVTVWALLGVRRRLLRWSPPAALACCTIIRLRRSPPCRYRLRGGERACRVARAEAATSCRRWTGDPGKGEGGERRRILVVDDEADIRRLVQEALAANGYHVETAADGDEAVRKGS